jgi:hypothetical protein
MDDQIHNAAISARLGLEPLLTTNLSGKVSRQSYRKSWVGCNTYKDRRIRI